MAEADTLAYYNKLAAARAAQPITPAVGFTVRQCDAKISGDAIYTYRCPAAWLEYSGAPSAQTAELVFPRAYFTWVKSYLLQALMQRPGSTASAEFRVVWALDVWAHVNFALFALPFPWSDIYSGGVGGVPELALTDPLTAVVPRSLIGKDAEVTAWSNEKKLAEQSSSTAVVRDAIVNSRLNPSPFSELAVQWAGAPGSRSPLFQKPNPIWPLLLAACQPWSSSWTKNWLASKGNKDAADVQRWSNEPVMLRAAMQWRLWSVQDWGYTGFDATYWPYSMGRANNTVLLSSYIASVRGEQSTPKIAFHGSQAYPNLAFGLAAVALRARAIASIDYDTALQTHLLLWLGRSAPRLAADGSLAQLPDGSGSVRQPITRTDYADYFKGLQKVVTDRARAALANPALNCAPTDAACLKAAGYGAKIQAAIQSSPLAPVQNTIMRVADKLVSIIGAAIGGGYEPLFVLRDPFCRTFNAAGYRLLADGSSADAFYRIALAVANYQALLPGLFSAQAAQSARTARGNCRVYWTRSQLACEVCEGEPRPACAADVPNLPPQAAASKPAVSYVAACDERWANFLAESPQFRGCLTEKDRLQHNMLCAALLSGSITQVQAANSWLQYLKTHCAGVVGGQRSLWAQFTSGFLRASNPLR